MQGKVSKICLSFVKNLVMGQQVQMILEALEALNDQELQIVHEKLLSRLKKRRSTLQLFDKYAGKGKGIWPKDAQQIVHELRQKP